MLRCAFEYGDGQLPGHPAGVRLADMEDPAAELAAYFQARAPVPDQELIRLTCAARAGGHSWASIAAACQVRRRQDTVGIVFGPGGMTPHTGAGLLYQATQGAVERVTGSRRCPPLTWHCADCGQQVTDRAGAGRPIHTEHGHAAGCRRLRRDQAAAAARRCAYLPTLVASSEPAIGSLQRHRLTGPIIDDCPRCGWSGYFHEYLATVDGDWSTTVCDNCYADLHPGITVTLRFFSARSAGMKEPFAVIRERSRSDYRYPDLGEQLAWRLSWEHTTVLVEEAHGECGHDVTQISRDEAERLAASLARRYWPPDAAQLPWVQHAYPQ
jgi:hypothetical protein